MQKYTSTLYFTDIPIPDLPTSATIQKPSHTVYSLYIYTRISIQHAIQQTLDRIYPSYKLIAQKPSESVQKNIHKSGVYIDITIPCFPILKKEGMPAVIQLANTIEKISLYIDTVQVAGPYINISLDIHTFGESVISQVEKFHTNYGFSNIGDNKKIVIDYSSPNIAKYMNVAHLRSTVIGQALYHIYKAIGYQVIRDNHLGDWGTQFGMLGRAVELWGKNIPQLHAKNNHEVVQGLLQLYIKMHDEVHREETKHAQKESSLKTQGRAWFAKLEQGDTHAIALWKWALEISLIEFKNIYARLGVNFDYWIGESFYVPLAEDLVNYMQNNGYAKKDEHNRIVVYFNENQSLIPLTIRKSDGTGIYASRDLACLVARHAWFQPAKILYVVGEEQSVYFRQIFQAFHQFAKQTTTDLHHVSFGLLSLPEGKMSTRRGNVIFLADVINEAVSRAKKKIVKNYGNAIPANIDIDATAEAIGIGAVIYSDLGGARKRNIIFNWDDALAFQGNSGPYIQYAYARICSIEDKIQKNNIQIIQKAKIINLSIYEKQIIRIISEFPETIIKAAKQNEPSILAMYVYNLASNFNSMYKNIPFLHEKDIALRSSRIRIARAVHQVMHNCMKLLNIPLVSKM